MANCKVCSHPRLGELQNAITERKLPLDQICAQFGINRMTLSRHNRHTSLTLNRAPKANKSAHKKLKSEVVALVKEYELETVENPGKRMMHWHGIDSLIVDYVYLKWQSAGEDEKLSIWRDVLYATRYAANSLQNSMRLKIEKESQKKADNRIQLEVKFLAEGQVPQDTDE